MIDPELSVSLAEAWVAGVALAAVSLEELAWFRGVLGRWLPNSTVFCAVKK